MLFSSGLEICHAYFQKHNRFVHLDVKQKYLQCKLAAERSEAYTWSGYMA